MLTVWVIDPKTQKVSHIVVRKGLLFAEDRVLVPYVFIVRGKADRITLELDANKLDTLPNYEETHYIALNEEELARGESAPLRFAPAIYWYPPYPELPLYIQPAFDVETKTNIPNGTVALKEGAKVFTRDDKHIGNVEQVSSSSRTGARHPFLDLQGFGARREEAGSRRS